MGAAISEHSRRDRHDSDVSARLLSAIETAHSEVELCIVALETIMAGSDAAVRGHFSAVRLRLARTNLARTQLAREACSHLISISSADHKQALRNLEQREIDYFQMISSHVQRWTPQAVQDDWQGYCEATRRVLHRARELITIEGKLLLPLLRQPRSQA